MSELTKEIQALNYQVDGVHDFVTHDEHVAERVVKEKSSHSSLFLPSFLTLLCCIGDNAQSRFGGGISTAFIFCFLSGFTLSQISIQ